MPGRREDEIPEVFAGFRGYRRPRYTPVPSQFLDEHLCFLSGSEVKVLLYIMRHTYGYGKNADHISARQISEGIVTQGGRRIDYGTGLSRSSVWKAIQSLEAKGLVEIIRRLGPRATTKSTTTGSVSTLARTMGKRYPGKCLAIQTAIPRLLQLRLRGLPKANIRWE